MPSGAIDILASSVLYRCPFILKSPVFTNERVCPGSITRLAVEVVNVTGAPESFVTVQYDSAGAI